MNKKAGTTDLFIFMIVAFVIILISAIFIYLSNEVRGELHEKMDGMQFGDLNTSQVIDDTIGKVDQSYQALYWISAFLIFGMIISIFIGSYLVTTRPVFFIPYIFIVIIAIIVGVGISNAYEQVIADPTLSNIFDNFIMANFIMLYLPIWMTVIGITGGVIMYSRMGSREGVGGYYG